MALVKYGGGVASISGKIDGTVYSRNRSGAIARGWTKPTNPQTPLQEATRLRFSDCASLWSELPAADQLDWESLAATVTRTNRLGETYTPTGRQIFLEVNNAQLAAGQAAILAAPPDLNPPFVGEAATTVLIEITAGVITGVPIGPLPNVADAVLVIDATPLLTVPKNNVKNLYRQIHAAAATTTVDLTAGYTTTFGSAAIAGQIAYFRVRWFKETNGIFTTPTVFSAIGESA